MIAAAVPEAYMFIFLAREWSIYPAGFCEMLSFLFFFSMFICTYKLKSSDLYHMYSIITYYSDNVKLFSIFFSAFLRERIICKNP